jgi:hypothetical protein
MHEMHATTAHMHAPRQRTWPREALAMGCGVMLLKMSSTGAPSSISMMRQAVGVSKGSTLSCSSDRAVA